MCGIVGFTGRKPALPFLLEGLARLEYRGYDSAGVAVIERGSDSTEGSSDVVSIVRCPGKMADLMSLPALDGVRGDAGIGHTRWATHGRPSLENSHPQTDCTGEVAIVHNGIIENFRTLRAELEERGCTFRSDTDSEVIAHLVSVERSADRKSGLVEAVRKACRRLEGAFAIAVVAQSDPDLVVGVRRESPLVAGVTADAGLLASDFSALISETRDVVVLEDDQIVALRPGSMQVSDLDGNIVEPTCTHLDWDLEAAERGGYEDFMLKEIHEQPRAVADTLRNRYNQATGKLFLDELRTDSDLLKNIDKVFVVACGTSYHAGLAAKYAIEHWVRLPVEIDIASEFRYRDPVLDSETLVIGVSQSGETLDTIAACRYAKQLQAKVIAVANVVDSTLAREADAVVYTHAGPEIGVAATKTFLCQIAALELVALYLAQLRGTLYSSEISDILDEMHSLPDQIESILAEQNVDQIKAEAARWSGVTDAFYIGRGPGYPTALEGALKMKEISYLHAEGYPAGELKHGPLALIEDGVPVVAVVTNSNVSAKTLSNVEEVAARGGRIILLTNPGAQQEYLKEHDFPVEVILEVPETHQLLAPMLDSVVLQLLAYYVAKARGRNVDKPRNLAKTVTVE